jgi:crotonobetainyl-CoA:carnitine CoA-transferase CaiB-like acyl-CoA transferase
MNTPADFVDSEQTRAREFFVDLEHPVVGRYKQVGPMHKYGDPAPRLRTAAPLVGQHTQEILECELGLSADELNRLKAEGVV